MGAFMDAVRDRFGELYERDPVEHRAGGHRGRRGDGGTVGAMASQALDERIHVTRSRRRPGGGAEAEGRPFRERKPPWLKVPAPGGPTYRHLKEMIALREPQHRLRGGQLPQRRRVLGARHRDVHDPRRRLHPALRVLQRPDGKADLERPARADARRRQRQADGPAPRRRHLGGPRRPARLRRRARSSASSARSACWRPTAGSRS